MRSCSPPVPPGPRLAAVPGGAPRPGGEPGREPLPALRPAAPPSGPRPLRRPRGPHRRRLLARAQRRGHRRGGHEPPPAGARGHAALPPPPRPPRPPPPLHRPDPRGPRGRARGRGAPLLRRPPLHHALAGRLAPRPGARAVSPPLLPVVYDERYAFSWPGHVFPTEKYRLTAEELLRRGVVPRGAFLRPEPATREELLLVHGARYLEKLEGIAAGTAPWDPRFEVPVDRGVVDAFVLAAGGTVVAARAAVARGAAANLTGGFHHAYPDHGEGFCLLHDAAVAVEVLRGEGKARRALFVDLDVHQGNGTIACFARDPDTFTFSIHEENNYPVPKERGSLDVGLPTGAGDGEYLDALEA